MIRIGDSATCSLAMVTPESRVVETRRYLITKTQWYEIARKCIAEKKFLILTICIGFSDRLEYMPTETQWRSIVEDSIVKLLALGGNLHNCRIDIINEPMKYTDKSTYIYLVNLAHNQIKGRLPVGAGCEEFVLAQAKGDMYQHLVRYGNFEVLVIHLQGSCSNEVETTKWTNYALNLATSYKKKLDCNEANYSNVATSKGYEKLKMQLKYAEKIGCSNFPVVFLNLDQKAFSQDTDKWKFLSFKVNGRLRSPYWNDFKNIIEAKAPKPNIQEVFYMYGIEINYVKIGSKNEETRAVQQIMLDEGYNLSPYGADGIYGSVTKAAIEKWQADNKLKVDGWVGKETWQWIFENIETGMLRFMQMIARTGRYK